MLKYRFINLFDFPDCIFLSESGRCTRLTMQNCRGKGCSFKRTQKEDSESIIQVYNRLSNLDITKQKHIAEKYYGGSMPWREEKSGQTYRGHRLFKYILDK